MQQLARWFRASLRAKLFTVFLSLIVLEVLIVLLMFELLAAVAFEGHVSPLTLSGQPLDPGQFSHSQTEALEDAALLAAFSDSVNRAALMASGVAVAAAITASFLVSSRITNPIERLVSATKRIAAGNYSERIPARLKEPADALGQLAHSFNYMAASLEATERQRIELIRDVAHELGTPISTLKGYLEGLLDGVVQPSVETWANLYEEADRLQQLVGDLRDLSRAEGGQLALDFEAVDLAALVEGVLSRLKHDFDVQELELTRHIPCGLPPVMADRRRTVQVLTNFLTNALRYTPSPGTVDVSINRMTRKDELCVQVSDTGLGISQEDLPCLFERFYRVDKSRSRATGGSGIGLTIARALVEAMGGRIWAESAGLGIGSTFSFTLPLAPTG